MLLAHPPASRATPSHQFVPNAKSFRKKCRIGVEPFENMSKLIPNP
jgi:hypothetical protein